MLIPKLLPKSFPVKLETKTCVKIKPWVRFNRLLNVWVQFFKCVLCCVSGHVGTVYALTVLSAPGQTRLFSASYDRSLRVSSQLKLIMMDDDEKHV